MLNPGVSLAVGRLQNSSRGQQLGGASKGALFWRQGIPSRHCNGGGGGAGRQVAAEAA